MEVINLGGKAQVALSFPGGRQIQLRGEGLGEICLALERDERWCRQGLRQGGAGWRSLSVQSDQGAGGVGVLGSFGEGEARRDGDGLDEQLGVRGRHQV